MRLLFALTLAACARSKGDAPPDANALPDPSTAPEPDDSAIVDDTAAADDTAPAVEGSPRWDGAFRDAPDLRIAACGTDQAGRFVPAPGPDLDGDGLAEVAVGVPGEDGTYADEGAVYVFRGADLATDTVDVAAAWARVVPADPRRNGELGTSLHWVGDRDGDGFDDLLVWHEAFGGHTLWVSGAELIAGGEVLAAASVGSDFSVTAWDDLDADGRHDWIASWVGDFGGGVPGEGVTVLLDADFGTAPVAPGAATLTGIGGLVRALDEDLDADGLREIVTEDGDDLVVVSSLALVAGSSLEGAILDRRVDAGDDVEDVLDLGDVDGGGAPELLLAGRGQLCVARGEDADADGADLDCVRSADAEAPTAVALGDDLDGDGVREVWAQLSEALVAWDGAAIVDGDRVERARIAHRFAAADGLADADAAPALVSVHTAGEPGLATWVDLTGDGADELVFLDDRLAWFDGAGLAAGGDRTMCDADGLADLDLTDPFFVDDADGDGVADLLGRTREGYVVASGAALAEGAVVEVRVWPSDLRLHPLDCDVDADGRDDFYDDDDDVTELVSGSVALTGEAGEAVLGSFAWEAAPRCVPDAEGDGRPEIVLWDGDGYVMFLSSRLDPSAVLSAGDAHARLVDAGYPEWSGVVSPGDVDGDGADDAFFLQRARVAEFARDPSALCTLDGAMLAAGGEIAASAATCGVPWMLLAGEWTVAGDVLAYYETPEVEVVFAAVGDAGLAEPDRIAFVPDGSYTDGGFGPDVLGVGAPSLWATTTRDEERPVFEALFARD